MTIRHYAAWLWLLSGLPIGLALVLLPPIGRFAFFMFFVLLETGHSLSPIVLAWTHREFRRRVIYPQPRKFLLWPAALFLGALTIGVATQVGWTSYGWRPGDAGRITGWNNPLPLLVWFYSAWNLFHFAMQDYGVWRLWRQSKLHSSTTQIRQRVIFLVGLLTIYFAVGGLNLWGLWQIPGLVQYFWWLGPLVMTGAMSVNHWIVDIGLSTRVAGWVFPIIVLLAGVIGFVWIVPTSNGTMIRMVPVIVCARLGLGFVHFLYSRWIWQLSDPQVRATIGRELFA